MAGRPWLAFFLLKELGLANAELGSHCEGWIPGTTLQEGHVLLIIINPIPYHADYFGHKLHIDQNEKLVMFGITHICAIDGYSGMIVGFVSMPIKNNLELYTHLFRWA